MILSPIKQYISINNKEELVYKNFISSNVAEKWAYSSFEPEIGDSEKNFIDEEKMSFSQKINKVYQIIQQGNFARALLLLESTERENNDPLLSQSSAVIKYDLGILYDFLGKYKIALEKFREALNAIDDENNNSKFYYEILEAIAITQDNNGNHAEALLLFQKIIAKKQFIYGEKSLEIIYSTNNQAIALYNLGKFEECEKILQFSCEYFEF